MSILTKMLKDDDYGKKNLIGDNFGEDAHVRDGHGHVFKS
jgi:hypothetical protein